MKPSTRRVAGFVSAWVAVVAVVVSAQQPAPATPPAGAPQADAAQQDPVARALRAEKVLQLSCGSTTCHTIRPIQTAAMDRDAWTKEVNGMIEKGAMVDAADVPGLIDVLTRDHGPLPDGPGKAILLNTCTICHDLQRVRTRRATPAGWQELLEEMLFEGAPLSDDNLPILLNYLARNFRPGQ
jgi:cytochrome c5